MSEIRLDTPYQIKGLTLRNRTVMAPMCQYSVTTNDGVANEWHYIHYVTRAVGGTGLIIVEMTNVEPAGRISDRCLGIWSDDHIPALARIVSEAKKHGAKAGIQIAHAGRKAKDTAVPVGPSAIAFDDTYKTPHALSTEEVKALVVKFGEAAKRAVAAGFDTIEIHGAHGYLLHQFHSPLTNKRDDEYGQDLARFGVEVIQEVKRQIPVDMPLLFRISALEYVDGGHDLDYGIELCRRYREAGVDLFDISTGGEGEPGERKPGNYPGFQVPAARAVKAALDVPVIAVGILEDAKLAHAVLANGDADLIAIGRGLLRDPYWPLHAFEATKGPFRNSVPVAYKRGFL